MMHARRAVCRDCFEPAFAGGNLAYWFSFALRLLHSQLEERLPFLWMLAQNAFRRQSRAQQDVREYTTGDGTPQEA